MVPVSCSWGRDGLTQVYVDTDGGDRTVTTTDLTNAPAGSFTAIDAAYHFTCGLRATGEIACWGASRYRDEEPDI